MPNQHKKEPFDNRLYQMILDGYSRKQIAREYNWNLDKLWYYMKHHSQCLEAWHSDEVKAKRAERQKKTENEYDPTNHLYLHFGFRNV